MQRICKRVFSPVLERSPLVAQLDAARERGEIHSFTFIGEVLTVWRPWVDGTTMEEEFLRHRRQERKGLSYLFFREVRELLLGGEGHGALHPGNVFLLKEAGGFALTDAGFNRVTLCPRQGRKDDIWSWGPCIPEDWSMADWDLVSLLRTAALLAVDERSRKPRRANEEAQEICRRWARDLKANSGNHLEGVDEALDLLPRIPESIEPPPFPLEGLLEQALDRQRPCRMLPSPVERQILAYAVADGITPGELDPAVQSWLIGHGACREQDLRKWSADLLRVGWLGGSWNWVSERSCSLAEQILVSFGVAAEGAHLLIQEILRDNGWLDGRVLVSECRAEVSRLQCQDKLISSEIDHLAATFSEARGLSAEAARQIVDLEIERTILLGIDQGS